MERIKEKKINTTIHELCDGLPQCVENYFKHVRNLQFEERPDYNYLRKLFKDFLHERGDEMDVYYDWTIKKLGKEINKDDMYEPKKILPTPADEEESGEKKASRHKSLLKEIGGKIRKSSTNANEV